jgi:hypothetical protein
MPNLPAGSAKLAIRVDAVADEKLVHVHGLVAGAEFDRAVRDIEQLAQAATTLAATAHANPLLTDIVDTAKSVFGTPLHAAEPAQAEGARQSRIGIGASPATLRYLTLAAMILTITSFVLVGVFR